jgi:hypothetical protein
MKKNEVGRKGELILFVVVCFGRTTGAGTKMVHGRARASSRQTRRVALNEVR